MRKKRVVRRVVRPLHVEERRTAERKVRDAANAMLGDLPECQVQFDPVLAYGKGLIVIDRVDYDFALGYIRHAWHLQGIESYPFRTGRLNSPDAKVYFTSGRADHYSVGWEDRGNGYTQFMPGDRLRLADVLYRNCRFDFRTRRGLADVVVDLVAREASVRVLMCHRHNGQRGLWDDAIVGEMMATTTTNFVYVKPRRQHPIWLRHDPDHARVLQLTGVGRIFGARPPYKEFWRHPNYQVTPYELRTRKGLTTIYSTLWSDPEPKAPEAVRVFPTREDAKRWITLNT